MGAEVPILFEVAEADKGEAENDLFAEQSLIGACN